MANEEKELFRFINDPKYRERVINSLHKEEDNAYNKRIKIIESERDKLHKARKDEVERIANSRWQKIANGRILINRTEGKIRINNTIYLFSSIQGAELNMISGYRVETTEQSKSKKHASLGGAVAGGIILGPVGAVAGGVGLGKTKTKGSSVSNQIPTCTHLGVLINVNGFVSEIVLIASQVDQSGYVFSRAYSEAQNIISQLGVLAKTPVPQSFLKPEEESSVTLIDSQIERKQRELQEAIANIPNYEIPLVYRTKEQIEMSDEKYLQYLKEMDEVRIANEMAVRKERAELKAADKQKRKEEREIKRRQKEQDRVNARVSKQEQKKIDIEEQVEERDIQRYQKKQDNVYIEKFKFFVSVIIKIVFWLLSLFLVLFALVSFLCEGIVSGIIFFVTALIVNPLVREHIFDKLIKIPIWVVVIVLMVGFFAGLLNFPLT